MATLEKQTLSTCSNKSMKKLNMPLFYVCENWDIFITLIKFFTLTNFITFIIARAVSHIFNR